MARHARDSAATPLTGTDRMGGRRDTGFEFEHPVATHFAWNAVESKEAFDYSVPNLGNSPRDTRSRRTQSPRLLQARRPAGRDRGAALPAASARQAPPELKARQLPRKQRVGRSLREIVQDEESAVPQRVYDGFRVTRECDQPRLNGGDNQRDLLFRTPPERQDLHMDLSSMTPRQRAVYHSADLLVLASSPLSSSRDGAETVQELLDELLATYPQQDTLRSLSLAQRNKIADSMFRSFILDLSIGKILPQLTGTLETLPFLLSVSQDLQRLVISQRDGAILEFPLIFFVRGALRRRSRRKKEEVFRARKAILMQMLEGCEEDYDTDITMNESDVAPDWVVFTDFTYRRLAFVFQDEKEAIRFKACLLLLARLANKRDAISMGKCDCSDAVTLGCLNFGRQSAHERSGPTRNPKTPGILPQRASMEKTWAPLPINGRIRCDSPPDATDFASVLESAIEDMHRMIKDQGKSALRSKSQEPVNSHRERGVCSPKEDVSPRSGDISPQEGDSLPRKGDVRIEKRHGSISTEETRKTTLSIDEDFASRAPFIAMPSPLRIAERSTSPRPGLDHSAVASSAQLASLLRSRLVVSPDEIVETRILQPLSNNRFVDNWGSPKARSIQ
eukprot:Gregarina_sp_Poly_1__4666@NODE_2493_length_2063_cov_12_661824_g1583_i0_p1_GENE_NODE_2493_length_2063_cov_12_661824_g1583_i0NODE_2493_length_2063_cov_12_661824_g1583_i0_p1_ORF_typecomplete_len620_score102_47_NODE_2493_length_2063_cov_12_661824_g1583_i0751934